MKLRCIFFVLFALAFTHPAFGQAVAPYSSLLDAGLVSRIAAAGSAGPVYNVMNFGATGTEQQVQTGAITSGASHNLTISLPISSITGFASSGYNYTSVPTVSITGSGGGSAKVVLSSGTSGVIIGILLLLPGAYSSAPTATITAPATGSTPSLTVNMQGGFTSASVGMLLLVNGAGASGNPLNTTIASVTNQFTCLPTLAASNTVSSKQVDWGTDDSGAFNKAVVAAASNPSGGTIFAPAGRYFINQSIYWVSNVSFYGVGSGETVLIAGSGIVTTGTAVIQGYTTIYSTSSPMKNCHFSLFEIDCSAYFASGTTNQKGIGIPYVDNSTFYGLYVHDSAGTCIAFDFMNRTSIVDCIVANGGRGGTATSFGNSGIGLGTNGTTEGCSIVGCFAHGCTRFGIFLENQTANTAAQAKGVVISDCTCYNNMCGICDAGCYGAEISGNNCYGNVKRSSTGGNGIEVSGGTLSTVPGLYTLVTGNQCVGNAGNGIDVDVTGTSVSTAVLADIYPELSNNRCDGNTGWGIFLNCNTTSTFNTSAVITGNLLKDNTTGSLSSAGNFISTTGHPNIVSGNIGYNDTQTPSAVSVGSSPFTYTCGNTPTTLDWNGSITTITKAGATIAGSTFTFGSVTLLPGQSVIFTYPSTAPTIEQDPN